MKKKILLVLIALACAVCCALGLVACNQGGDGGDKTVAVTSITLNKTELALTVGESEILTATVKPDDATDKSVRWSASPDGIIRVENGIVTAIGEGLATITATAGDKSARCYVTVEDDRGSEDMNEAVWHEIIGDFIRKENFSLRGLVNGIQMGTVKLQGEKYCQIYDGSELIYVNENGEYNRYERSVTGTKWTKKTVGEQAYLNAVNSGTGLVFSAAGAIMGRYSSFTRTEEGLYTTDSITVDGRVLKDVELMFEESALVAVSCTVEGNIIMPDVLVIIDCIGQTQIEVPVIERIPVESVVLSEQSLIMDVNDSAQLTATVYPADATDKEVVWTSDNEGVARVENGVVYSGSIEGFATITATADGVSATCDVSVVNSNVEVEELYLSATEMTLEVGESKELRVEVIPYTAGVTLTVNKYGIVRIERTDGNAYSVTAEGVGTAEITATAGDKKAICNVTVIAAIEKVEGSEGLAYSMDGDYYYLSGIGTCRETEITVANYYKGTRVVGIRYQAFKNFYGITKVVLPEGLESIGSEAFAYCTTLESITLPESLKSIFGNAFYNCLDLKSITVPDGVTFIGEGAFNMCQKLTDVTIGSGVENIPTFAFGNCNLLENINLSASVKSIGRYAFTLCESIVSLTLPEGVESIGDRAYENCFGLTSVSIPASVTSIGDSVFAGCKALTDITVASGNTAYYVSGNCLIESAGKTLIYGLKNSRIPSDIKAIGNRAFSECTDLTDITLPEGLLSIGDYAFYLCEGLTQLSIPGSVKSIGERAFEQCMNIASLTINEGVEQIGMAAFMNCGGLTSITIPASITSIGESAFDNCQQLGSLTLTQGLTVIGNNMFCDCVSLTSITIPGSVISIGAQAFSGCSGLGNLTIEKGVKTIGDRAFSGCNSLTEITVPDSVTSIGEYAFAFCLKLERLIIGDGIETMGSDAFSNCPELQEVTVPDWFDASGFVFSDTPKFKGNLKDGYYYVFGSKLLSIDGDNLDTIIIPSNIMHVAAGVFKPEYDPKCIFMPALLAENRTEELTNAFNGYKNAVVYYGGRYTIDYLERGEKLTADGCTGDGWIFALRENEAYADIKGYIGGGGSIVVPDVINYVKAKDGRAAVIGFSANVFFIQERREDITKLTFKSSRIQVEGDALNKLSNLEEIELTDNVEIFEINPSGSDLFQGAYNKFFTKFIVAAGCTYDVNLNPFTDADEHPFEIDGSMSGEQILSAIKAKMIDNNQFMQFKIVKKG